MSKELSMQLFLEIIFNNIYSTVNACMVSKCIGKLMLKIKKCQKQFELFVIQCIHAALAPPLIALMKISLIHFSTKKCLPIQYFMNLFERFLVTIKCISTFLTIMESFINDYFYMNSKKKVPLSNQ